MMFQPGDEVVCIDATPGSGRKHLRETFPVTHGHYIVRDVLFTSGHECIRLMEIVNEPRLYDDCGSHVVMEGAFNASRFRPVKRESIELFKRMAQSNKPLVEV